MYPLNEIGTEQILSRTKGDRETFEDKHLLCSIISKYKYFQATTNCKKKNWNSYKKSRPQEFAFLYSVYYVNHRVPIRFLTFFFSFCHLEQQMLLSVLLWTNNSFWN